MTRVIVVHHDIDIADQEVEALRMAGYEADLCTGPAMNRCPVLRGEPCDAAERADVLLYDVWATGRATADDGSSAGSARCTPHPRGADSSGLELDWVEEEGPHGVTRLTGIPDRAHLQAAITEALAHRVEA